MNRRHAPRGHRHHQVAWWYHGVFAVLVLWGLTSTRTTLLVLGAVAVIAFGVWFAVGRGRARRAGTEGSPDEGTRA